MSSTKSSSVAAATVPSFEEQTRSIVGLMQGGLIFIKTRDRRKLVDFYTGRCEMQIWLEQPNITILSHGNFLLGLHQTNNNKNNDKTNNNDDIDCDEQDNTTGIGTDGITYTFVYPSVSSVNAMYRKLSDIAVSSPINNEVYRIHQFFARDPEGRRLEFQAFLHPVDVVTSQVEIVVSGDDEDNNKEVGS
jgi:hypothetical protein